MSETRRSFAVYFCLPSLMVSFGETKERQLFLLTHVGCRLALRVISARGVTLLFCGKKVRKKTGED
ncbi:TPA: hypothetical protein DEA21_03225 [Candidatus Uhrbacteria bacterium]|nr:hypothetical protein [Candidatus Uhrbacteria bacterium]HCU31571.1 hypothetical protein [Candidatus Uhrbacteria bacterium]